MFNNPECNPPSAALEEQTVWECGGALMMTDNSYGYFWRYDDIIKALNCE